MTATETAPEATTAYDRAKPLIEQIKDDPEVLHFMGLLSVNYLSVLGQNDAVADIAREAIQALESQAGSNSSAPAG